MSGFMESSIKSKWPYVGKFGVNQMLMDDMHTLESHLVRNKHTKLQNPDPVGLRIRDE